MACIRVRAMTCVRVRVTVRVRFGVRVRVRVRLWVRVWSFAARLTNSVPFLFRGSNPVLRLFVTERWYC